MTVVGVSFIWPWVLISLIALPVCVIVYFNLQRRRGMSAARLGTMGASASETADRLGKRRHIPPIVLLTGVSLLALASARPQMTLPLPRIEGTVVLAMDVSASMSADDVQPTRMEAAKLAAKSFADRRPDSARVGVVAFGEGGLIVHPPSDDDEALTSTIDRLVPQSGTSLGRGMLTALDLISSVPGAGSDDSSAENGSSPRSAFAPAIIVMFTDGENTDPPDTAEVAQVAIERGVRVHTVGVGTQEGAIVEVDGFNLFTQLNEPALQEISLLTEGDYFRLEDKGDIASVYEELDTEFVVEPVEVEITSLLGGIGALLFLASGALSLFWLGRAP